MNSEQTHCMNLLRDADRDRYLSVLYAPEEKRGDLFALYAFNAEIARIRDVVHDPLPGEMRLQWWRDLINGTEHGAAAANPVASALLAAIEKHNLPRTTFDNYCEARIFDLYNDPMPSRNDLEGYSGETASAIIQLASLILDRDAAPQFAELAGHGGVAQAVTGILRLLPIHRRRKQMYFPADMLRAVGADDNTLLGSQNDEAASRAILAMTALAEDHLRIYEAGKSKLPTALGPAFLPVSLCRAYLDAVKRKGTKALDEVADISALRKHWIMFRSAS